MQDVNMGESSLGYMFATMLVVMVCVVFFVLYVWPTMVKVYWYCADTLYAMLYRNQVRTRR